jgi:hypothetical protein
MFIDVGNKQFQFIAVVALVCHNNRFNSPQSLSLACHDIAFFVYLGTEENKVC